MNKEANKFINLNPHVPVYIKLNLQKVTKPGWFKFEYIERKYLQVYTSLSERRPNSNKHDKVYYNPERVPVSKLHLLLSKYMYLAFISPVTMTFKISHDFEV